MSGEYSPDDDIHHHITIVQEIISVSQKDMYYDTLHELLWAHPDWNWDWRLLLSNPAITSEFIETLMDTKLKNIGCISSNPYITTKFIRCHINEEWVLYHLSRNPTIGYGNDNLIESFPEWDWDWYLLMENPSVTPELIERLETISTELCTYSRKMISLSRNPSLTPEFINRYINWEWNWRELSSNPCLTQSFIEEHIHEDWNWCFLSRNPVITPEFIERLKSKTHGIHWCWFHFSGNPSITPEFLEKHPEYNWNWNELSTSMPPEFIIRHMNWKWIWLRVSINPRIFPRFVRQNMHLEWNWDMMSSNPNLDPEFVFEYPHLNWNVDSLSINPVVTPGHIIAHPEVNWNVRVLSSNSSLTTNFVEKHVHWNWNWNDLSMHLRGRKQVTDEFKYELCTAVDEMRYRPGNTGYREAKDEFMSLVGDKRL